MCEDVEAWTFEQNEGEAVLIPAGCSYQVRNLKVHFGALDFIFIFGKGNKKFTACVYLLNICVLHLIHMRSYNALCHRCIPWTMPTA
jgi:hypothetical protein